MLKSKRFWVLRSAVECAFSLLLMLDREAYLDLAARVQVLSWNLDKYMVLR